jgi:hypothetical protein
MDQNNGTPAAVPDRNTTRKGKGKRVNNTLNARQKYRLTSYVDTHRDRLLKMPQPEVMAELSEKMGEKSADGSDGFAVTVDNVVLAYRTVGMRFPRNLPGANGLSGKTRAVVRELQDKLAAVELSLEQLDTETAARVDGLGKAAGSINQTVALLAGRVETVEHQMKKVLSDMALLRSTLKRHADRFPTLRPFYDMA